MTFWTVLIVFTTQYSFVLKCELEPSILHDGYTDVELVEHAPARNCG